MGVSATTATESRSFQSIAESPPVVLTSPSKTDCRALCAAFGVLTAAGSMGVAWTALAVANRIEYGHTTLPNWLEHPFHVGALLSGGGAVILACTGLVYAIEVIYLGEAHDNLLKAQLAQLPF